MASRPSPLPRTPDDAAPLDVPRPSDELRPRRSVTRAAARLALTTAFHGLQPASRERFARDPDQRSLVRRYYSSDDGWQAPIFHVPARPGSTGEPVILAHGLGVNRHSLDYCAELSLARALAAKGFEVFLFEHRGDRSAIAPRQARPFDFDDIVTFDVPAAIEAVRELSGAPRVLWVGHAMGGQLLYAHLARGGVEDLAGAVTLCAPVRFPRTRSTARAMGLARQLLPPGLTLPARAAAALLAPSARDAGTLASAALPGEVARGLLLHGTEDLCAGLLRQAMLWVETGHLTDRDDRVDYVAAMQGVAMPLLLVSARGDLLCAPEQAEPALHALRGAHRALTLGPDWGHLDPLLGPRAPAEVFPELAGWLDQHRAGCWTTR